MSQRAYAQPRFGCLLMIVQAAAILLGMSAATRAFRHEHYWIGAVPTTLLLIFFIADQSRRRRFGTALPQSMLDSPRVKERFEVTHTPPDGPAYGWFMLALSSLLLSMAFVHWIAALSIVFSLIAAIASLRIVLKGLPGRGWAIAALVLGMLPIGLFVAGMWAGLLQLTNSTAHP